MCDRCGGGPSVCIGNCPGPMIALGYEVLIRYWDSIRNVYVNNFPPWKVRDMYKTLHKIWLNSVKFQREVVKAHVMSCETCKWKPQWNCICTESYDFKKTGTCKSWQPK